MKYFLIHVASNIWYCSFPSRIRYYTRSFKFLGLNFRYLVLYILSSILVLSFKYFYYASLQVIGLLLSLKYLLLVCILSSIWYNTFLQVYGIVLSFKYLVTIISFKYFWYYTFLHIFFSGFLSRIWYCTIFQVCDTIISFKHVIYCTCLQIL